MSFGPGVVLIRKPETQASDSHDSLNEVDYVVMIVERRTAGPARLKDSSLVLGLASHRRPDRVQGSRPRGMCVLK